MTSASTGSAFGDLPDVFAGVAGKSDDIDLLHAVSGTAANGAVQVGERDFDCCLGAAQAGHGEFQIRSAVIGHAADNTTPLGQVELTAKSDRHSLVGMTPTQQEKLYVVVTGLGRQYHLSPSADGNVHMTLCGREVYRAWGAAEYIPGHDEPSCKVCLHQLPRWESRQVQS